MMSIKIAMFTFMLFFSLSIVGDLDLYAQAPQPEVGNLTGSSLVGPVGDINATLGTEVSTNWTKQSESIIAQTTYGDFFTSITMFASSFGLFIRAAAFATIGIPWLLNFYGFPMIYSITLAIFINLNYVIAVMQIVGRFGFKQAI